MTSEQSAISNGSKKMGIKVKITESVDGYDIETSGQIEITKDDKNPKIVSVSSTEISFEKVPVLIKSQVFSNSKSSTMYYYASVKHTVGNTVSSSWSNVQPIFDGENIEYEVIYLEPDDVEKSILRNPEFLEYSQMWGKSSELTHPKKLQDFRVPRTSMLAPGKSITVELRAVKHVVKATIQYCCSDNGSVSYSTETIVINIYNDPKSVKVF